MFLEKKKKKKTFGRGTRRMYIARLCVSDTKVRRTQIGQTYSECILAMEVTY